MKVINNIKEIDSIINNNDIVIAMFGSSNCGPCRVIKEKLDNYLALNNDVEGIYIPTEKHTQYCASHSIFMVPTLIVYVKGKETIKKIRNVSFMELEEQINHFKELIK